LEFTPAIELLTDEFGQVAGAVVWNLETEEYKIVRAKATVLATGGWGRLHIQGFPTTNHYGATADGLVLAYRVGAKLGTSTRSSTTLRVRLSPNKSWASSSRKRCGALALNP
jgi:succinate dehydrogenase/fumarate reductase flavoprotein subunit